MNFLSKYAALLIPGGIVLVGVVLFIPTILIGNSIGNDMQESISQGEQVESVMRRVPSSQQYEVEKLYQSQHEKDAEEIDGLTLQSTQRELLRYDVFPRPRDSSQQIFNDFGETYRVAAEDLIREMGARDAPSKTDKGNRRGRGNTRRKKKGSQSALRDAVCMKRAESIPVYGDPGVLKWYEFWEGKYEFVDSKSAIEDCWYSQVSFWIYEDVVDTIKAMNADSGSVYTSPVKRFLGVSFNKPVDYPSIRRNRSGALAARDKPAYVLDEEIQKLGLRPWTGRISKDEIDVVHFSLSVIVESKSVTPFIKELCSEKDHNFREGYSESGQENTYKHNQITVLEMDIEPVERTEKEHEDYRYGDGSVVRLSLICEYIFNRKGYDIIKPITIRELLGQSKKNSSPAGRSGRTPKRSSRRKSKTK